MKIILASLLAVSTVFMSIPAHGQQKLTLHHHDATHQVPGTIVVPASDFFTDFPAGDSSGGGFGRRGEATAWEFNNNSLTLGVVGDVTAKIPVKEGGTYHLFVRGSGTPTSAFHVAIDGKADPATFGQGAMEMQRGGEFTLKPGTVEIKLTSIQPRPVFNVLVLTKNANFKEDDLKPLELPSEVKLLREYTIAPSNIVKFGDVDGSGKYAILDILNNYSTIMYANDGHILWRWDAPPTTQGDPRGNEAAGVLWDFHHTGRDELAQWRETPDGKEWLVLADGMTGKPIRQVPWPAPALPHVDNNYRMAVAKFHKDSDGPDTLLVFVDTGGYISLTAYDKDLNQLWQHAEHRLKDYFGHYIYPYDINGDGIDEVMISHLCLDANGKEIWNDAKYFEDNHDHMDAMEFFDMNGDGKPELLVGQSDLGTMEYNAQNGKIIWQNNSDHSQQVTAGYILSDSKTPQVVTNGRTYTNGLSAQLYWFDNQGRLLEKWPAQPLAGNPNFVRGDWYGTGKRTYFWYRFKLEPDGNATLYFKGEAYHMFDFEHTGADQVITLEGGGGGPGGGGTQTLRVYGYAGITPQPKPCNVECRKLIANHTHY
ncbi:MAG TPA: hypothetical protein VMQ60_05025 [Acidobacteriaceae bacterium]|jgi:hypothetical protein|nr:hypothetical protein [Acidobacteriaceae bacterium]